MRDNSADLVVFLGPSLPAEDARGFADCRIIPPARQGDIWRALSTRPLAIALVDGLFEAEPSVWHHEIVDALEAGVAVFGGASMGALRATELSGLGMVGIGTIFGWYRDGVIVDDSEVALLHAGPEHGFQAFTVPLVDVRHAADLARRARVLSRAEAAVLIDSAAAISYQERTWQGATEAASARWSKAARSRWDAFLARGVESLKARDARECIRAAAQYVEARRKAGVALGPAVTSGPAPSSLVRRRKLAEGLSFSPSGAVLESRSVLERIAARDDAAALRERGLSRALLTGWARELGIQVSAQERDEAERVWLAGLGVRQERREAFLAASGLDERDVARLCEDLALERRMLDHASRLISDGPSGDEALAAEARVRGVWAETAGFRVGAGRSVARLRGARKRLRGSTG